MLDLQQPTTITMEQMDDIPLLLALLHKCRLAEIFDNFFPTHGNWGAQLSFGHLAVVWLTFILSQSDHRLNHLEPWRQTHQQTLTGCLGQPVRPLDGNDDRLALMLDALADPLVWQEVERALGASVLRVYDLPLQRVRLDSTTVQSYAPANPQGLLQNGHSKAHRPDLAQLKVALATLDPLRLPLAVEVVEGSCADDPLYVPQVRQVREVTQQRGLCYVGDSKMGALGTRAFIAFGGDYYLCPLGGVQMPGAQLGELAEAARRGEQELAGIPAADGETQLGVGYEYRVEQRALVGAVEYVWEERRLVVRSERWAEVGKQQLERRRERAEAELERCNEVKRGKKRLSGEELEQKVEGVLEKYGMGAIVRCEVVVEREEKEVRGHGGKAGRVAVQERVRVAWEVDEEAQAAAQYRQGWRVYATNEGAERVGLREAVWSYREQYQVERGFGRLKGKSLGLLPMYLEKEERMVGLVNLLSVGLRVLCLLEYEVRRQMREEEKKLKGLYAGQGGRVCAQPTSELLLRAMKGISLLVCQGGVGEVRYVTPLNELQQEIVRMSGVVSEVYVRCLRKVGN
jgi:transposase